MAKQGAPKICLWTRGGILQTGCSAKDQLLLAPKLERWLRETEAFLITQQIIKAPSRQTMTPSSKSVKCQLLKWMLLEFLEHEVTPTTSRWWWWENQRRTSLRCTRIQIVWTLLVLGSIRLLTPTLRQLWPGQPFKGSRKARSRGAWLARRMGNNSASLSRSLWSRWGSFRVTNLWVFKAVLNQLSNDNLIPF
jgi:hypothetical protein